VATSAIDKLRAARQPKRMVRVDAADLDIWFSPVTTADLEMLRSRDPKSDEDWSLTLLVLKAEDEAGGKLFSFGDLPVLKAEIAANVIAGIVGQMWTNLSSGEAAVAEAKREIRADPPSGSVSA
jgi:hypothetical protein